MDDLGFFAITLENNTLHENICQTISDYIKHHPKRQIVLFNQYCEKVDTKNIPILALSHSKYFSGNLVVFDLQSLVISLGSIKSKNVYYYTQSIPWQTSYSEYENWAKIFSDNKLKVITGNSYLSDIYNIVWGNSFGICEEISYDKFSKFI